MWTREKWRNMKSAIDKSNPIFVKMSSRYLTKGELTAFKGCTACLLCLPSSCTSWCTMHALPGITRHCKKRCTLGYYTDSIGQYAVQCPLQSSVQASSPPFVDNGHEPRAHMSSLSPHTQIRSQSVNPPQNMKYFKKWGKFFSESMSTK